MTATNPELSHVTHLQFDVHLAAAPDAVFRALTADIAQWWPAPFYCGGGDGKPVMRLDARPGGLMFEDWGDGDGLLWGTVANVQRGRKLEISGTNGIAWGGPSTWYGTFELTPEARGTTLRFSESTFGSTSEISAREKEQGWHFLLAEALAAFVEGKQPPSWED